MASNTRTLFDKLAASRAINRRLEYQIQILQKEIDILRGQKSFWFWIWSFFSR